MSHVKRAMRRIGKEREMTREVEKSKGYGSRGQVVSKSQRQTRVDSPVAVVYTAGAG